MAAGLVHQLMRETPPQAWFLLLFPIFVLLVHYSLANRRASNSRQLHHRLPPSPPALPILGHLHLVGSLPHVSLRDLAGKHGPDLMLLRLSAMPTLVVSSPRAAEAVLRTHDHVFASRPRFVVADIILYGSRDISFAPYGEHWRQARKLVTTHLLSANKVQSFRLAREEESSKEQKTSSGTKHKTSKTLLPSTKVDDGTDEGDYTYLEDPEFEDQGNGEE